MKAKHVKRSYTLGVRAESARVTQDSIKAAAVKAFSARPFDLVSLRDIADDAQVTQQTVIRLFGSKEGLLATVADEELSRAIAERDAFTKSADMEEVLRAVVAMYEVHADKAIAFFDAEERYPPIRPVIRRARTYELEWLERLFAAYLPTGKRRARGVAQLYALLHPHAWRALRTDCGLTAEEAVDALVSSAMAIARSFK